MSQTFEMDDDLRPEYDFTQLPVVARGQGRKRSRLTVQPHRKILDVLLPLRSYLQQEYQDRFDRAILFGSQARGDATAASDLDVLIVLQDPVNASEELDRTSQFIAQLCLEHNLLISRLFMPRSRFETENSPLLRNIRADGIVL